MGDGKWLPIGARLENLLPTFGEVPKKQGNHIVKQSSKNVAKNSNSFKVMPDTDDDWHPEHADQRRYLPKRPIVLQVDIESKKFRPVEVPKERIAYTKSGLRRRSGHEKREGNILFSLEDLKGASAPLESTNYQLEDQAGLERFILEPRPKTFRLRATCCGGGSTRPPDTPAIQHSLTPSIKQNGDDREVNLHPFFTNSVLRLEDMTKRVKINSTACVTNCCHSHDVDVFVIDYSRNHTEWSFLNAQPDSTTPNRGHKDYTTSSSFDKLAVTKRFVADAGGPARMPQQGLGVELIELAKDASDAVRRVAIETGVQSGKAMKSDISSLRIGSLIDNTTKGLVIPLETATTPLPRSLGDTEHEIVFVNRASGKDRNVLVGWLRNAAQMERYQQLQRKKAARAGLAPEPIEAFVPVVILPQDHQVTVKSRLWMRWAARDLESGVQLSVNVGALAVRSAQVFQITWTAHTPVKAVVSTKPSPSHTLQAHKQKERRLQRLQEQMLAAIEKAKQLRSDNNYLAATYADDELAALRKEFVKVENTPSEPGGSENTGPPTICVES